MTGVRLIEIPKAKRKKSARRIMILLTVITVLLILFTVAEFISVDVARAEESKSEEEVRKELSEAVNQAIDRLDLSELQDFINSLDEQQRQVLDINDVRQTLKSLVNGEAHDFFGKLMNLLANSLGRYFAGFLPAFLTVIVICLLKNMLGGMTSGFAGGSTTEVVHIVC